MRRDDRGAASAEFALVVPLFLLLVGIGAYFAWQAYAASQLERAAQRAARHAAVPTTEGAYAYRHCDVVDVVTSHLTAMSVDGAKVEVRDADATLPAVSCPSADTAGRPRGYVRVRVVHELRNPFSEVVGFMLRRPGPLTITASGEARVEDPT
ncbi:MAG TPA: TadE/TadG family type IV pilus assembly protein [Frankiaceae bacterium]|nr:TadE/TadG family type IV pilus assembly protein [Frankiaceae bacterium]